MGTELTRRKAASPFRARPAPGQQGRKRGGSVKGGAVPTTHCPGLRPGAGTRTGGHGERPPRLAAPPSGGHVRPAPCPGWAGPRHLTDG